MDLSACFDEFSRAEQLGEDDAWFCPQCRKHQQATKKLDIWRLPDILIVHLKRFSHSRYRRDKIDNLIDFPVEGLDLSQRVFMGNADGSNFTGNHVYDLFAVSNHFGGLGGGHYTAFAKNRLDGRWYDFDDSSVTPIEDIADLKRPAAYVLYYQQRGVSDVSNGDSALNEGFETPRESPIATSSPRGKTAKEMTNGNGISDDNNGIDADKSGYESDVESTVAVVGENVDDVHGI